MITFPESTLVGKTVHEITVYRMVLKKEKMHQRLVIMKAKLNQ